MAPTSQDASHLQKAPLKEKTWSSEHKASISHTTCSVCAPSCCASTQAADKEKIRGWERRAVSRQRLAAQRLPFARSELGLEHKALADKITCDEHVCIFNSFFNCFTSLSSYCIVTWRTHLILSGSLIRGITSSDPRHIDWGPLARLAP